MIADARHARTSKLGDSQYVFGLSWLAHSAVDVCLYVRACVWVTAVAVTAITITISDHYNGTATPLVCNGDGDSGDASLQWAMSRVHRENCAKMPVAFASSI